MKQTEIWKHKENKTDANKENSNQKLPIKSEQAWKFGMCNTQKTTIVAACAKHGDHQSELLNINTIDAENTKLIHLNFMLWGIPRKSVFAPHWDPVNDSSVRLVKS